MFQSSLRSFVLRLPCALKQTPQWSRTNPVSLTTIRNRNLSFTAPRYATESPKPDNAALFAAFQETSTFKKISQAPEALLAIQNFAKVLRDQGGVDISKGMPLSKIQMTKLMMNSEFREASKNLMEEFKKAGLDPQDQTMRDEITNLMKFMPKV